MSKRHIVSSFFALVVVAAAVWVAMNAQLVRDTIAYYQYTPSDTMATFVGRTGMGERGEFLFYASHPSLEEAESFNKVCSNTEQNAAILGCYNGQTIFIYNITDPRLDGIRPTTAAHEMLHAAYSRLSETDKANVNALLEAEYVKLKDDNELSSRMAFYEISQPGDRDNELHSIIGTEVRTISDELERYYGRYFSDRSKVIAEHEQYHSVFKELRSRADALSAQIDRLEGEIGDKKAAYNEDVAAVQRDIEDFNRRANQGDFSSQSQFAAERQALVARVSLLENLRAEINGAINKYNSLVTELNEVAVETRGLNRSIDSNLAPAPNL